MSDPMDIDEENSTLQPLEQFKLEVSKIVIDLTNIPKSKLRIPHKTRSIVWKNTFGMEIGEAKCFCCRDTLITQLDFQAGHIISEKKGGSIHAENLRPICSDCNKSMGTKSMYDFIKENNYWNK
jgi:5-methylcytosine-specific restriction endonuclease McrA